MDLGDLTKSIAVYHEGDARRVEFRLSDIENLVADGAASLLGHQTDEGLKFTVAFHVDAISGAVTGASVRVEKVGP